jgi:hypothetical protein
MIEFNIVERGDDGLLLLASYGEKFFVMMESGDGSVPEFNYFPPG